MTLMCAVKLHAVEIDTDSSLVAMARHQIGEVLADRKLTC
jgi:hypothetical protein